MHARAIALFLLGSFLPASMVLPNSAWGQSDSARRAVAELVSSPIGRVVTTTGSVTVERTNAVVVQAKLSGNGGVGQARIGDLVYSGDVIQTGADGKVGITFADGTAFNVSSNARMVLNEFVYEPNGKSNSTLLSLTKGAFTFIAGTVAKTGRMEIDTPVATMGIRGTTPHVEIRADGTVAFSTLIEEDQSGRAQRRGAIEDKRVLPIRQRQAQTMSSPEVGGDPGKKLNLLICRGC